MRKLFLLSLLAGRRRPRGLCHSSRGTGYRRQHGLRHLWLHRRRQRRFHHGKRMGHLPCRTAMGSGTSTRTAASVAASSRTAGAAAASIARPITSLTTGPITGQRSTLTTTAICRTTSTVGRSLVADRQERQRPDRSKRVGLVAYVAWERRVGVSAAGPRPSLKSNDGAGGSVRLALKGDDIVRLANDRLRPRSDEPPDQNSREDRAGPVDVLVRHINAHSSAETIGPHGQGGPDPQFVITPLRDEHVVLSGRRSEFCVLTAGLSSSLTMHVVSRSFCISRLR